MDLSVVIAANDDASLERSLASLTALASEVIVVRPGGGAAFAAFDEGARRARSARLLFLEGGVRIEADALERLADLMTNEVGIVVPTLCDEAGRVLASGRGLRPTRMSRFAVELVALHAGEAFDAHAVPAEIAVASAACMLTSAAIFRETGGFGERFADALGDVDFSLRVRLRGLKIVCARAVAATVGPDHVESDDRMRLASAFARLDRDWRSRIGPFVLREPNIRETRVAPERYLDVPGLQRPITVFVSGAVDRGAMERALIEAGAPIAAVLSHAGGLAATAAAREAMEVRGERAIAFVDAAHQLDPGWLGALARELAWGADVVAATSDAGPCLVALSDVPQHMRLDATLPLDRALDDLLATLHACGLGTRSVGGGPVTFDGAAARRSALALPADGLASIIMLSWNAPNYTKIALESIRAHTRHPHEIIIVDNGSGSETTDWLHTLTDVRVIFNPTNLGFAGGNNVGIAAARGDYVVILNNDVVVTDGWLENLVDALQRNPLTGISAPRSNRVAGSQLVADANYPDVSAMHRYAAERRAAYRKTGYYLDRAIGFCLCVDRRLIEEIGGIDETFGAGNFEDDDFCVRARAAGYRIYVCDDVFIHHFGSISFTTNKVDYAASMSRNWLTFARKWGYPERYPVNGYLPQIAIAKGFDRRRHFVALPTPKTAAPQTQAVRSDARARFVAVVRDETDWATVGAFVRRFGRAFTSDVAVALDIAACGTLDAVTLGERVVRLLERERLDAEATAEIAVDDVEDVDAWLDALGPARRLRVQREPVGSGVDRLDLVEQTSPSGLRRALEGLGAPD